MAVDIAPRNASGAALGVVGIASYVGAGIQDVMSGILIEGNKTIVDGQDVYDFTAIKLFLDRCSAFICYLCIVSMECKSF